MADANSIPLFLEKGVAVHRVSAPGDKAACHPDRPAASRGMCRRCYKQWLKETPKANRPPATYGGRGALSTPSTCHSERPARAHGLCQQCYLARYRETHRPRLLAAQANNSLLRSYGISAVERDAMVEAQGGVCAICRKPPAAGKRLHVDHCHQSGLVRGMLCHLCNSHLGLVDRDPAIIDRLRAYRERP